MAHHTIVTISRQFGSGGRQIGKLLAEKLGVPFYDKELISMAAQESGLDEEVLEEVDERPSSLLYALSIGMYSSPAQLQYNETLPMNDRVFFIQSNIIRRAAKQGSCVVIGRCADFVLQNNPDAVHVFVQADLPFRVRRAVEQYGLPAEKAESMVLRTDRQRASYHNFYADKKWGKLENYHLVLNSGFVGIENAAELIGRFAEMRANRP